MSWDISTANYEGKSFSLSSQIPFPFGLFFKSDGTKVYSLSNNYDKIYQYSLSTAWDISTSSYDSKDFSVASQETNPQGLFFKSDGSKVYIIGSSSDTIYQYSLSTAWDISTASYDSKSVYVFSQDSNPRALFFSSDGTKVYIVGTVFANICQFNLSTAWDISTASYASKRFNVTSQERFPLGLFFTPNGTQVFIVGSDTNRIYQYSLSTAWDISTASYDSKNFSVNNQDTMPTGLFFKSDGTNVYVAGYKNSKIYQYSLNENNNYFTMSFGCEF